MIFTPANARAVMRGAVTQTRIPASLRCRFKPGHHYAVQSGHGKAELGRVTVLYVALQPLGQVEYRDARAEGFRSTDDLKIHWVRKLDKAWIERELIDRIAIYDDGCSIVNWILLERFDERYKRLLTWKVSVEVAGDVPRFMARATRTSGDYVHHPGRAIDREECIPKITNEIYSKASHEPAQRQRQSFRDALEDERGRRRRLRVEMLKGQ